VDPTRKSARLPRDSPTNSRTSSTTHKPCRTFLARGLRHQKDLPSHDRRPRRFRCAQNDSFFSLELKTFSRPRNQPAAIHDQRVAGNESLPSSRNSTLLTTSCGLPSRLTSVPAITCSRSAAPNSAGTAPARRNGVDLHPRREFLGERLVKQITPALDTTYGK